MEERGKEVGRRRVSGTPTGQAVEGKDSRHKAPNSHYCRTPAPLGTGTQRQAAVLADSATGKVAERQSEDCKHR